jgi:hypothetical protein
MDNRMTSQQGAETGHVVIPCLSVSSSDRCQNLCMYSQMHPVGYVRLCTDPKQSIIVTGYIHAQGTTCPLPLKGIKKVAERDHTHSVGGGDDSAPAGSYY